MPAAPPPDDMADLESAFRLVRLDPPTLRRSDVERRSGVDAERALKWWRAMGLPEVGDDDIAFGEDDTEMVIQLQALIATGAVGDGDVLRLARLMGASFSRLVDAQLDTVDQMLTLEVPDANPRERWTHLSELAAGDNGDVAVFEFIENAMVYVWRRHLLAALGQRLSLESETDEQGVGFADLSGFSRVSKEASPDDLAEIIDTFERVAFDVVSAHEGRVVKMVGDGVMFVTRRFDDAVDIGIDLIDRLGAIDAMPPVHCGLGWGPTITVGGDVFGPTVNLASRLAGVARPGSIALPRDVGSHLLERDDLDVRRVRRPYDLKGVGRTSILVVRPRTSPTPIPSDGPPIRSRA